MKSNEDATMKVLVTGGAGYIGGHTVLALLDRGFEPIILDDLSAGVGSLVPKNARLVVGDVGDRKLVADILTSNGIDTILHFAGKVDVAESVINPLDYYLHNTIKAQSIIRTAIDSGVKNFIFSSTAAVYGQSEFARVDETCAIGSGLPVWTVKADDGRNPPGCPRRPRFELRHSPVFQCRRRGSADAIWSGYAQRHASDQDWRWRRPVASGHSSKSTGMTIRPPDGTCIRDFIHVSDLADAHLMALSHLRGARDSITLNCGYGRGYSVKEVLSTVEEITGKRLQKRMAGRRTGDPVSLVSDSRRLFALGWKPKFDDLAVIIEHAYKWELALAERPALLDSPVGAS